jgi:error-prone DNA polymerase
MKESLGLARRQALWAIKALRDEPLELWTAAAEREARMVPELTEHEVAIRPMTAGGEVVEDYRHVGLHHLTDLSHDLASVGERDGGFPLPHGRGDQVRDGGSFGPDQRDFPPRGLRTRDIYIPDLHIDSIKVKTRDFR